MDGDQHEERLETHFPVRQVIAWLGPSTLSSERILNARLPKEVVMSEQSPSRKMLRDLARITAPRITTPRVTTGRSVRAVHRNWFTQVVCLSMVASLLLFLGLVSRAQDSAQEQGKSASEESGFLG